MEKHLNPFVINSGSSVEDAARKIKKNRHRCLFVLAQGKVTGVISASNILKLLIDGGHPKALVDDHMSINIKFLTTRNADAAKTLMKEFGVSLIPILSHDFKLLDVISIEEIMI